MVNDHGSADDDITPAGVVTDVAVTVVVIVVLIALVIVVVIVTGGDWAIALSFLFL